MKFYPRAGIMHSLMLLEANVEINLAYQALLGEDEKNG
jgi:hypothetical protein